MPIDRLILVGAGGHARVVFDALKALGTWASVEIRDDVAAPASAHFDGLPVIVPALPASVAAGLAAHVAIGQNETRQKFGGWLMSQGARLASIVHPRATVSPHASIGDGVFVAAQAIVAPDANVSCGVIINHNVVIDHDCVVGSWSHVGPGAILGGGVVIGSGVLVGAGAVILPGVHVGDRAVIAAGAVVTKTVAPQAVVVGVPARETAIQGTQ